MTQSDEAGDAAARVDRRGSRARRSRRPGTATVAAIGLLVVSAGACTTPATQAAPPPVGTPPPATSAPTTASTTTTTEAPTTTVAGVTTTTRKPHVVPTGPPGPLTGAPVDKPGNEKRPALVVKIDNYDPDARPQVGVSQADVVYEEKVEGPYSRFAAVFQGSDADQIGPVRSARSTDVQIVGDLNRPLFAYSGANGGFAALLTISPLVDVGAGSAKGGAYWRGGDKAVPHNLYTSTAGLYAGMAGAAPDPLWPFRAKDAKPGAGAVPATGVAYQFGGQITSVSWAWDPDQKQWVRTQNGSVDFDMDNWPIAVDNIIVQYVHYENSTSADIFGHPIPEALLGGTGRGFVLTGGAAIPMTWARNGLDQKASYDGPDGNPIQFAPGHTWIVLLPAELPASIT